MNDEKKMMSEVMNESRDETLVDEMEVITAQVGSYIAKKKTTAQFGSGTANNKVNA